MSRDYGLEHRWCHSQCWSKCSELVVAPLNSLVSSKSWAAATYSVTDYHHSGEKQQTHCHAKRRHLLTLNISPKLELRKLYAAFYQQTSPFVISCFCFCPRLLLTLLVLGNINHSRCTVWRKWHKEVVSGILPVNGLSPQMSGGWKWSSFTPRGWDSINNCGSFDCFCASFCVKIISIFLAALCCGNNSVIRCTRQHMAAVFDQQPPLRGDWDMLIEQ